MISCFCFTVTHSMEQSHSWEAVCSLASQQFLRLLWTLNVNYCAHNRLALDSVLSQMNPVHILASCFCKIHFNTTLPSITSLPCGLFPSFYPTTIVYIFSVCATSPPPHQPHPVLLPVHNHVHFMMITLALYHHVGHKPLR
jgi:hypothetical protein